MVITCSLISCVLLRTCKHVLRCDNPLQHRIFNIENTFNTDGYSIFAAQWAFAVLLERRSAASYHILNNLHLGLPLCPDSPVLYYGDTVDRPACESLQVPLK